MDGSVIGTAIVRLPGVGVLPQDVSFHRSINRLLLFGGIAAGLIALLLGIVLARKATAPARELAGAARAFAAGDRTRRVSYDSPDEFGEMARSFNVMGDAVEEEDRLRKAFAAEVAHELHTPLAILRSQVEAIQDGVIEPTPPAVASPHEETLRLTRLVGDLETLASADAAGFTLSPRPVSLRTLVEESIREFAGPYEAEGVRLETELEDVVVDVDSNRFRQVIGNLLSNALKFTPTGGLVWVRLRFEGDFAILEVTDTGPGIPPDELPEVFDRFFRGRSIRAGGSGIGLTVVEELVEVHGGTVEVSSELGIGTTFTVRLPEPSSGALPSFTGTSHRSLTVGTRRRR